MRNIFLDELYRISERDERVVFLMAECGFSVVEKYEARFPERFFNVGIAEQSLVGTAAGIALRGLRPVAYTMAMFLTMRAYEQIRVDVAYQNLPVILAGVGPGVGYGAAGVTHHVIEDLAIMRALPNMHVVFPGNEVDVRACLNQAIELGKPIYIALARNPKQLAVPYSTSDFKIGKAIRMNEGKDAALFACGSMLPVAMEAAELLMKKGIKLQVYNMHTVKPLDTGAIEEAVAECSALFSLEEANIIGGLGGAMAEYIAEHAPCRFKRLGIQDVYLDRMGDYQWILTQLGIDAAGVAASVAEVLNA
jgi:transketolase